MPVCLHSMPSSSSSLILFSVSLLYLGYCHDLGGLLHTLPGRFWEEEGTGIAFVLLALFCACTNLPYEQCDMASDFVHFPSTWVEQTVVGWAVHYFPMPASPPPMTHGPTTTVGEWRKTFILWEDRLMGTSQPATRSHRQPQPQALLLPHATPCFLIGLQCYLQAVNPATVVV